MCFDGKLFAQQTKCRTADFSAVEGDEDTALHFAIRARFERRDGRLDYRLLSLVSVWLSSDGTEAQFRKFCT